MEGVGEGVDLAKHGLQRADGEAACLSQRKGFSYGRAGYGLGTISQSRQSQANEEVPASDF